MRSSNLELIRIFRDGKSKNPKVEVKCKLCGQVWTMWQSHYYRGDTPCNCHHLKKQYPRLYSIYTNMKNRCYNEHTPNYKHYGSRGITICEDWLNSFVNFKEWALSNGYSDNLTIERINVDDNYTPNNCTWIPMEKQASNKTNTIKVDSTSLRNWCIEHDLNYKLVHQYKVRHPEMRLEEILTYYLEKYSMSMEVCK